MSTTAPQQANGQPAAEQIRLPGAPPPPEAPKSHQLRTAIIGAICALALAGLAVAAILLVSNHATVVRGPSPSQAYQTRLSAVLTPIVASNRTLSSAVQAIDGSRSTLRVASDATCQGSREFPRCDHGNSPPGARPVSAGRSAAMASRWRRMR